MSRISFTLLSTLFLISSLLTSSVSAQDDEKAMQDMLQKMQKHATPGDRHAMLGHMIGKWKTEMTMMGAPSTEGVAEFNWILGKRYVEQKFKGTMMGMPYEGIGLFGYDNYKKKFTSTWIDSMSTTKNHAEGLLDRTGKIISYYGTMDEYLTDEHDKPVKYVLDLSEKGAMNFEIHDLALGEDSKVVGIRYTKVTEADNDGWSIKDSDDK